MRRDRQRLCQLYLGKQVLVRLHWAGITQLHTGHLHEVSESSLMLSNPMGERRVLWLHLPLRAIESIHAVK